MKKELYYSECHYKLKNELPSWKDLRDENFMDIYEEHNLFKEIRIWI